MLRYILLISLYLSSLLAQAQSQMFTPVQEEHGINHYMKHENFMGGGLAFVDINNDGYDDIYVISGKIADHLYLNDGTGHFVDISEESGIASLTEEVYTNSVNFADVDRDGDQDLFICTTDDKNGAIAANLLLINDGNLQFSNVWTSEDKAMSLGASFLDYDKDGWIDIYVLNYVEEVNFIYDDDNHPIAYDHTCTGNWFYKNNGDGSFTEIGESAGLADTGCALAVLATDIDMDQDPDLLIANDFGAFIEPNKLYINDADAQTFTENANAYNVNSAIYGMGIAGADVDLDGDLDYYISNFGSNELLINEGLQFNNEAIERGVDDTYVIDTLHSVTWGSSLVDFDNDMDADLFISNGFVPSLDFITASGENDNLYFENKGDGYFEFVEGASSGINDIYINRGSAHADFDRDGDVDFMSVSFRVPSSNTSIVSQLYRNNVDNANHWLQIDLVGVLSNTNAFGAVVRLYCEDQVFIQELYGGSSHCSQHSSTLHFGLGDYEKVDSLFIDWPSDGPRQSAYNVLADQRLQITEGVQIPSNNDDVSMDTRISIYPNPSNGSLTISASQELIGTIHKIEVVNPLGQAVPFHQLSEHQIKLDGPQGLYLLNVYLKNGMLLNKQIIIR